MSEQCPGWERAAAAGWLPGPARQGLVPQQGNGGPAGAIRRSATRLRMKRRSRPQWATNDNSTPPGGGLDQSYVASVLAPVPCATDGPDGHENGGRPNGLQQPVQGGCAGGQVRRSLTTESVLQGQPWRSIDTTRTGSADFSPCRRCGPEPPRPICTA